MDRCDERITLSWMAPSNFGGGVDVDRNREWSHGKIVVSEAATIEKYDVQYRERGRGAWMDLSPMGTEAAVTSGSGIRQDLRLPCAGQEQHRLVRPVGFHDD